MKDTHKSVPVQERHLFRGLRHKLEGTKEESERYEKEIQEHLRQDAQDHIDSAKAKEAQEKKDGFEGLGSKK